MKAIKLLVITAILSSCNLTYSGAKIKSIKQSDINKAGCWYELESNSIFIPNVKFLDSCGKFNVGDKIYFTK